MTCHLFSFHVSVFITLASMGAIGEWISKLKIPQVNDLAMEICVTVQDKARAAHSVELFWV